MDHTHIVPATDLDNYANRIDSQGVIPELIYWLVKQSVSEISVCRIPYGDSVNQPGMDGLVETEKFFLEFVPYGKSFWEIGTGGDPQSKATIDFKKRNQLPVDEKAESVFIFVTPRSSGANGWNEPKQAAWLKRRKDHGWKEIRIIDGVKLADWLREFPAIGQWMAKKIGISPTLKGLTTPAEHWETIQAQVGSSDPPLPSKVFTTGRENACTALQKLFAGQSQRLFFFTDSEKDVQDFVAGYLASLDAETKRSFSSRCLFVSEEDAWRSVVETRKSHVLVADLCLGLDSNGADLQTLATQKGHTVIVPVCGAWSNGNPEIIKLRSPSQNQLKDILSEGGYSIVRVQELASAGAYSLSALRRHLLGLGSLPPYATWENARLLAQAGLIGKWDGKNQADQTALEVLLGKEYGEWIEMVRPEVLRSGTPLIQRNEKWNMIVRGEAWIALGPHLSDDDVDRLQQTTLNVLGERDPQFDLPKEKRFAASLHEKQLKHSSNLREGLAETLALLGTRPEVLSSCSQGKANTVTILTIRDLLADASWDRWAGLDHLLPILAEAAPDEFLDAVEHAVEDIDSSPFHQIFSQEGKGGFGERNYICGLLWGLETLAWHPDYLTRVVLILGELASIDPGGNWANRPSNSLADILLPWHLQTCAPMEKRKSAVETLLLEQPDVAWKLLTALLPHSHGFTSGCRRPAWRNLIVANWTNNVSDQEYWEQIGIYTDMAIRIAKTSTEKLSVLIERLPDIHKVAFEQLLSHLSSDDVTGLPERHRVTLWEALNKLVRKHRKFPTANWSLPEEILVCIESTAGLLEPQLLKYRYHYLFSGRDFDLYDEKGSYEDRKKQLDQRRQNALQEILEADGVAAVREFACTVSAPNLVGYALGSIAADSVEDEILPAYLENKDEVNRRIIGGFILGRFWKLNWPWVDRLLAKEWDNIQKSTFLVFLPFEDEAWTRAEEFLGNEEGLYWRNVFVTPWRSCKDLTKAVEKLILYERAGAAVQCLSSSVDNEGSFDPELAIRALLAVLSSEHPESELDGNATIRVITKLQSTTSADTDALFKIEWNFLPLLGRFSSGSAKTLENRLASDPTFFCELIASVFRSKNAKKDDEELTEQQRSLAQNAYKLLHEWKTVPGIRPDGSLDSDSFISWLAEVKRITKESGHFDSALYQIGEVLTYTPGEKDGLWIHIEVARALNNKDAKKMRTGFIHSLFNQRGVHDFTAGEKERKLAQVNRKKSEALEANGYSRFSTAMREFAKEYEKDAEREKSTNLYDD